MLELARMVGHRDLRMLQVYYNESAAGYSYYPFANLYQGPDGSFYVEVDGFAQRKAVKVVKTG